MKKLLLALALLLSPLSVFGATNLFNNVWIYSTLLLNTNSATYNTVFGADTPGSGVLIKPIGLAADSTAGSATVMLLGPVSGGTAANINYGAFVEGGNGVRYSANSINYTLSAEPFTVYDNGGDIKVSLANSFITSTNFFGGLDASATMIRGSSVIISSNLFVNGDIAWTGNATMGDGSPDTLLINASTATTPNGLNFNSGQFNIATNGNNGMGSSTLPTHTLTFPMISSTNNGIALYNTLDQTNVYERVRMYWTNNVFLISTHPHNIGSGIPRILRLSSDQASSDTSGVRMDLIRGSSPQARIYVSGVTAVAGTMLQVDRHSSLTNGSIIDSSVISTITQGGTAGFTSFDVNSITNTVGSGTKLIVNFRGNSNSVFSVNNAYQTTIGTNGTAFLDHISNTGVLDFASQIAGGEESLAISVPGTTINDSAFIGVPFAAANAGGAYTCFTSNNAVYVKFSNATAGIVDPPSATFRATTIHY